MRFRVIRTRFSTRAIAALLALLVCGSTLDWGHVGGDDRDCITVLVQHDHNAHRLSTAAVSASHNDHCLICHSLRLLHHAVASRYRRVTVALQTSPRFDGDVLAVRDRLQ